MTMHPARALPALLLLGAAAPQAYVVDAARSEISGKVAFFGLAMNLGPIATWGLDLVKGNIAVEPSTCQTSSPGIFAIGDIAQYPGKLKLILQGFAEAAMAAHAAHKIVHPGEVLHFEYSTTKGVPGG